MTFPDLLRALLPPVAYDVQTPYLGAVLAAEGNALTAARDSAQVVADAMEPDTAGAAITNWERLLALVPTPGATQAGRAQAVIGVLSAHGGLAIPYFVGLAAGVGYAITILEPRAFRAGVSRVSDRLWGEDVAFVWQVRIDARPAGADAALDAGLEALFQRLKPAHTECQFVES